MGTKGKLKYKGGKRGINHERKNRMRKIGRKKVRNGRKIEKEKVEKVCTIWRKNREKEEENEEF